jgi:CelD/BcsL family acetyltransferase involved in cellulose biosynthesis
MPSSRDPLAPAAAEYAAVDALPPQAATLLDGDFFSTAAWYRTVTASALPPDAQAVFVAITSGTRALAVFPMLRHGGQVTSLTTPYTCLWRPLLAPSLGPADIAAVWAAFGRWCRQAPHVRLDALAAEEAAAVAHGLRGTGLVPLAFDHFGNWHGDAASGFATYLAARPGHVREAVRRRGRRLIREGAAFTIVTRPDEVEAGIAAYEEVYARSWKTPEPFPHFNAALMRACAKEGSLRLGLLTHQGALLAAQFWVVRDRWAAVLKLAHDEAAKAASPGTVLTALMIERLLEHDAVTALDFGRGDDPYKESWTTSRRQRVGLVLANPRRAGGLVAVGRHWAGRLVAGLRGRRPRQPGALPLDPTKDKSLEPVS